MRTGVYQKLCKAQDLLPQGMGFYLYEGWRSLALQDELFQAMYQNNHAHFPRLNHEELFLETTKLVSPLVLPSGHKNHPPHATGAAIDIYSCSEVKAM